MCAGLLGHFCQAYPPVAVFMSLWKDVLAELWCALTCHTDWEQFTACSRSSVVHQVSALLWPGALIGLCVVTPTGRKTHIRAKDTKQSNKHTKEWHRVNSVCVLMEIILSHVFRLDHRHHVRHSIWIHLNNSGKAALKLPWFQFPVH